MCFFLTRLEKRGVLQKEIQAQRLEMSKSVRLKELKNKASSSKANWPTQC